VHAVEGADERTIVTMPSRSRTLDMLPFEVSGHVLRRINDAG